jgi:hypothetical protein
MSRQICSLCIDGDHRWGCYSVSGTGVRIQQQFPARLVLDLFESELPIESKRLTVFAPRFKLDRSFAQLFAYRSQEVDFPLGSSIRFSNSRAINESLIWPERADPDWVAINVRSDCDPPNIAGITRGIVCVVTPDAAIGGVHQFDSFVFTQNTELVS